MSDTEPVLDEILSVLKRLTVAMEDISQTLRKIEKDGIELVPKNQTVINND